MRTRIGYVIKKERERRGWSQQQLANILTASGTPYSQQAISDWETETKEPPLGVLCKLAERFHISPGDFFIDD